MSQRIHIVTGSRALARYPDARERVLRVLRTQFALHPCEVLVVGDARGPDAWAADWALGETQLGIEVRVYEAQTGLIRTWARGASEPTVSRWATADERVWYTTPPAIRPLMRNAEMVRDALALDPNARMSAFTDPASPTQGTTHTVLQVPEARRRELVTVYRWAGPANQEHAR